MSETEKIFLCAECNSFFADAEIGQRKHIAHIGKDEIEVHYTQRFRICPNCGEDMLNMKLSKICDFEKYEKYKIKCNLITSSQLKKYRNKYNLSQRELAEFFGLGEKSIAKYEDGAVQSDSVNTLFLILTNFELFKGLWELRKESLSASLNEKLKNSFTTQV